MLKRAQRRSFYSKLREKVSPSQFLEKFSPTFKEQMGNLRELDAQVREEATRLKAFLKITHQNLNKKEYLKSFANLVSFYDHVKMINDQLIKFKYKIKAPASELLSDQLTDEEKELILKSKPKKATIMSDSLTKEAGLLDFMSNLFNKRYWALSALETKFSDKELTKFSNSLRLSVNLSDELFTNLQSNLKAMSIARATRSVTDYFNAIDDFHKTFKRFEKQFQKTSELAAPFIKHLEDLDEEEKRKAAMEAMRKREEQHHIEQAIKAEEKKKQDDLAQRREMMAKPVGNLPNLTDTQSKQPAPPVNPSIKPEPNFPKFPKLEMPKSEDKEDLTRSGSFDNFITHIEKIANQHPENPQQLIPAILLYSEELDNQGSLEESQQLLAIAEGIADESFLF